MSAVDRNDIREVVRAKLRLELVLRSSPAAIAYIIGGAVLHFSTFGLVEFSFEAKILGILAIVCNALRLALAKGILKNTSLISKRSERLHASTIYANAIIWGITFSLCILEWTRGGVSPLFAMVCLSGFSGGAITSLAPIPSVINSFALLTNGGPALVVGLAVVFGHFPAGQGVWMAPILVQALYLVIQGKQVRTSLAKRFEAEELLRLEKIELEETNESLRKTRRDLDIQTAKAQNSAKFAALGTMAGGVAHEINNPLAMITGHVSHIIDKNQPQDDERSQFTYAKAQKVIKAVDRIAQIIRGLRVFSREAEEDPFVRTPLRQIVEDTLSFCREKLARDGIKIDVDVDPGFELECRPVALSQVLLNLLNNSADAVVVVQDKWIKISAKDLGQELLLSIEDSGPGVAQDISQKIFEPFFTTKDVGKGTGLGLSISRSIAEEHGGELALSSSNPKCFELRIPKRHVAFETDPSRGRSAEAA